MDPRQGHHRNSRLGGPAAGDLIALHTVLDVLEDEREPALLRVVLGEMPFGQRPGPIDPVTELAVEGDLTQVHPQVDPDVAAVLVGGGELDDHALSLALWPAVADPVALAHLPGTDRLDANQLQAFDSEHGSEPFGRDAVDRLDHTL